MYSEALYRVEERLQNGKMKYYLLREIHSNGQKFRATKLITCGTPPTEAELSRAVLIYGFDLEIKCCEKTAKYRVENYTYELAHHDSSYMQLELFRLMTIRYMEFLNQEECHEFIMSHELRYVHESAKTMGCTFTYAQTMEMNRTGRVPDGSYLRDVNEVQNMFTCVQLRRAEPRKVTARLVIRIHKIMMDKVSTVEPVDLTIEEKIQKTLDRYYQRINEGYHPFEQMIIWYREFRILRPFHIGTRRVGREIVHYMAFANGYPLIFQTSEQVLSDASTFGDEKLGKNIPQIINMYMGERLPTIETALRNKIIERWNMHQNTPQKKLDTFFDPIR